MSTAIQILDGSLQPLAAPPSFAALPGARSNVEALHVVNNFNGTGADTATELALRIMERDAGETVWNASGRPVVDGRRVEVRITGGVGGFDVDPSNWQPVGAGRDFPLPTLANGQGVAIEISLVMPLDAQGAQVELYLAVRTSTTEALGGRMTEAVGDGVYLGLGDGAVTQLLEGGEVAASVPPDDQVEVATSGWIAGGVPQVTPSESIALDSVDGDGAALAIGNAYWALVHLTTTGSVEVVRSAQGPAPLDDALRPATPADSVSLAMVLRDDTGIIDDIAIEQLALPAASITFDGLTGTVGPSQGLVDSRWWRHDAPESVTVDPSVTSYLWRLPTGNLGVTIDGSRPDPRALLLYKVDADAFGVVEVRPRWRLLGRSEVLRFAFAEQLAVGSVVYSSWPHQRPGYILPRRGQVVAQLVEGAGTGGTTEWDIEIAEPGQPVNWVSQFGTERPSVPWDTTTRTDASSLPEVVEISPHSLLRCTIIAETASAQPSGGVVSLTIYF